MYRFLLGTLLFFSTTFLFAQQGEQYNGFVLRNYTAVHGLPQSQVNSIIEDDNGYLWMGTYGGGLARFDGQDFKVYTTLDGMLSNIVSHITVDREKNLWIVHPRGITRYDGISFKRFPASDQLSKSRMVRKAYVFKDSVFIISAPGVIGKMYKDSVYYWSREFVKGKLINRMNQFKNGNLCFFMNDGGVLLKTPEGVTQIGSLPKESWITSLYCIGNDMHVKLYDYTSSSTASYVLKNGGKEIVKDNDDTRLQVLYTDRGVQWLKDYNMNLFMLKKGSSKPDTVLKDREVTQIYPDSEGNVWIATNGSGLYKYFHQDFRKYDSEDIHSVMSIVKDKEGYIWIGNMNNGLWRIKDEDVNSFGGKQEILSIAESPDGYVWIGAREGIGKYDKVKDAFEWVGSAKEMAIYSVLNISFDESGNVWVGSMNGLYKYDHKKFTHYSTEDGLNTNVVNSSYYSKIHKTLFVGNEFGINAVRDGKVETLDIKGFQNTSILSIYPYRDSLLLLGSGGAGFAVYNPSSGSAHFINTHEGLISDFIYFIGADEKQNIWVGSEKGISRIILNRKFEIEQNLHFNHENGLLGVETNQNAFYLSPKQKLFGLIDGLYEFNEPVQKDYNSFKIHLTNVDIFYGEESTRKYADSLKGFFKLPYKPVFPSDKNHITFSFNRVDKRYPNSVRFKYMLKNYDKSWSKASTNKQVTYGNLPPGSYEFQAVATDSRGSWSEVMLRYPFTVKAPFYQTATFAVISFLLVLGVIIFVAYLRVRQRVEKAMTLERIRVREQDSLRKEIARDFHDEMGNQLTRIINYISLLKLNGNGVSTNGTNGSSHVDLYTKVENSAKYLYTGTRDFIWSIDPINDELSKLFIHIRDFGENLFEEKNIQFRANNGVKEKIRLPYGFSREVNLIFKEAMTNTFKYSQCENATISLVRDGLGFQLSFEDDGVGFNASEIEKLNGLKNIRERADKVQAVLRIHSREGSGTKISLGFQFTKTQQYGATV